MVGNHIQQTEVGGDAEISTKILPPQPTVSNTTTKIEHNDTKYQGESHGDREPLVEIRIKDVQTPLYTFGMPDVADTETDDNFSYPSELILKFGTSGSLTQSKPVESSSADSESDSPIGSFAPSDSDDSFHEYSDFMSRFRVFVKTRTKLVFKLDDFFEQSKLFPVNMDLGDWNVPEIITSKTLQHLKISAPKSLLSLFKISPTENETSNDKNNIAFVDEKMIRDRVTFLLRKIQSFNLQHFEFINNGNGCKLGKMSRIALWHNRLEHFLNRHSATLEKLVIKTVMSNAVARYAAEGEDGKGTDVFKGRHKFSKLKELDLLFWAPPNSIEKAEEARPWTTRNLWIQFIKSRAHFGKLSRIVWMCPHQLSFMEIWNPVFSHNKETLTVVHILVSDSTFEPERGESLREKLYTFISCTHFIKLTNLKSLYLRNSLCFLQKVDLLPQSLTELALDGLCLETNEIILAIKNLINLKKLRLVESRVKVISMKCYAFGVDLNVIKSILSHRKLDEVFIWGYTLTAPPEPYLNKQQLSQKSRSKFRQSLKDICSLIKSDISRLTRSKSMRKVENHEPQIIIPNFECMREELEKIAWIDQDSFIIKDCAT